MNVQEIFFYDGGGWGEETEGLGPVWESGDGFEILGF